MCRDIDAIDPSARMQVYKDGNHKPEMAIALTDFEALCAFVEHGELVQALSSMPELRSVVGEARSSCFLASPWLRIVMRTSSSLIP